jgi:hypothetical protein
MFVSSRPGAHGVDAAFIDDASAARYGRADGGGPSAEFLSS